jgi:hypothetical protein
MKEHHHEPSRRQLDRDPDEKPAREGDVLGISDADPDVEIPRATQDRGGNPAGIEVGERATGIGDVRRSSGATGIDMGAGGEGTHITSRPKRPRAAKREPTE